jgi:hypothetical protein
MWATQGDVRFVATLGKERPSKMFLTMDAAHEALIPAVEALEGAPWDPLTLQVTTSRTCQLLLLFLTFRHC